MLAPSNSHACREGNGPNSPESLSLRVRMRMRAVPLPLLGWPLVCVGVLSCVHRRPCVSLMPPHTCLRTTNNDHTCTSARSITTCWQEASLRLTHVQRVFMGELSVLVLLGNSCGLQRITLLPRNSEQGLHGALDMLWAL